MKCKRINGEKIKGKSAGWVGMFEPGKPPTMPEIRAIYIAAICHTGYRTHYIYIYIYIL